MAKIINITKTDDYVYDISLDGTVVNALGGNVMSNTDGFNFKLPTTHRYTEENPYIGKGLGRNVTKGKKYIGVNADVAEFEDLYMTDAYEGGVNKMGLGIDEYCQSTINFSRKNYADFLANGKTKKVGNTIKSRRMSGYIETFLDNAIDMLLRGEGDKFLDYYYDYIYKIYNYQIPLKEIASKGKIKKTIEQYLVDCNTLTKSGSKKSRQAWYELVIKHGMKVELNDTIYYINTGSKKSESDVKRITHQYTRIDGELVEIDNKVKKILLKKALGEDAVIKGMKTKEIKEIIKPYIEKEEDEIILNCEIVPQELVDSEDESIEGFDIEYNVIKYIEQFNSRIKPLLVCFSADIRGEIMITNPDDRKYFTKEQCQLVSGQPTKDGDQDTYEQLMRPERKEIEYWLSIGEEPPFIKECGIDWDALVRDYKEMIELEKNEIFQIENEKYLKALRELTKEEVDEFEDEGTIPSSLTKIVSLDSNMYFKFLSLPDMSPSTGGYVFDDIVYMGNDSAFEEIMYMETTSVE